MLFLQFLQSNKISDSIQQWSDNNITYTLELLLVFNEAIRMVSYWKSTITTMKKALAIIKFEPYIPGLKKLFLRRSVIDEN